MGTRSAEAEVKLSYNGTVKNTLTDGQVAQVTHAGTVLTGRMRDGVGASQVNRMWEDERTLTTAATETLDIYSFAGLDIGAGAALDALGQSLVMEELVTLLVFVDSASAGSLEIEPGATNAFPCGTHTVAAGNAFRAGGVFLMHNPDASGFNLSSTVKNIKFTANGGAVTYTIVLIGRHDDEESSSSTSTSTSSLSSSSTSSLSSTSSQSSQSSSSTSTSSTSSVSSLSSSSSSSLSSLSSSSSSSS